MIILPEPDRVRTAPQSAAGGLRNGWGKGKWSDTRSWPFYYSGVGGEDGAEVPCDSACMARRKNVCASYTVSGTRCDPLNCAGGLNSCKDEKNCTATNLNRGIFLPINEGIWLNNFRTTQPVGFLSKLGAEGQGPKGVKGAHILVAWYGTPFEAWDAEDTTQMTLSTRPRHPENLAMSSYPFTKLFNHRGDVFTLQLSDDMSKPSALSLHKAWIGANGLERKSVATIDWSLHVTRRMDFLCQAEANEETTLASSSPGMLQDEYGTHLLLNIKNTVHLFDISHHLRKGESKSSVKSAEVAANLVARSSDVPSETRSQTLVTVRNQMLYVHTSYNTIQSIDLSLHVPCGRVMDALQPSFMAWQVNSQNNTLTTETATEQVQLGIVNRKAWTCAVTKQVLGDAGATLTKLTACCSMGTTRAKSIPCCVEKHVEKGTSKAADAILEQKLMDM